MGENGRIRFGIFDFDPGTRELRREGITVHLQPQPAQVLAQLLATPGEVVTREALQSAVWSDGTFVDFERGLNFCVAQIRAALGDSADSPRFVRTLPKRGYQFIAPVERVAPLAAPGRTPARLPLFNAALLAVVWTLIALGFLAVHFFPRPLTRVAVARFDNETGISTLDRFADGLTDSVVADLTARGGAHYQVIGNAAILRRPREQRDLTAIASSLGAKYVVLGQVQGDASHVRILAHLIRMPEQTHIWVTRIEGATANPLAFQSAIAERISTEFTRRLAASAK